MIGNKGTGCNPTLESHVFTATNLLLDKKFYWGPMIEVLIYF